MDLLKKGLIRHLIEFHGGFQVTDPEEWTWRGLARHHHIVRVLDAFLGNGVCGR